MVQTIPPDALVIIWVTPSSYDNPWRLRGTDIYCVMCLPSQLEALTDHFRYYRMLFAEDNDAGLAFLNEIASVERGRSRQRKSDLEVTRPGPYAEAPCAAA